MEIHENRDNVSTVNNLEHDRSYSFTAPCWRPIRGSPSVSATTIGTFTRSPRFASTIPSPTRIRPPPPTTLPVSTSPPGVATTACPIPGASVGAAGLGALSTYASKDHFAHADLIWKPAKRVTATLGYAGSFVRGNTIFLNPLAPSGTLDYNYLTAIRLNLHRSLPRARLQNGVELLRLQPKGEH